MDDLHPDLASLVGRVIDERYRVEAVLGLGGMGAVFRAFHLGLDRPVAMKVLHPELRNDAEVRARFEREAESASRLEHPNCVSVTDFGEADGLLYLVMTLLEGCELKAMMDGPMPTGRALELVDQILAGLEHAHEHGVVHRDLKPENVFVTRDYEGREQLKLVDFGISRIVSGTAAKKLTTAGLIFGTPQYMSPEQAVGSPADGRADLYATGLILYELLAGAPAFQDDDAVRLVRKQVTQPLPALPESVPSAVAAVLGKLTEKEADERYSSASAARRALKDAVVAPGTVPPRSSTASLTATIIGGLSGPPRAWTERSPLGVRVLMTRMLGAVPRTRSQWHRVVGRVGAHFGPRARRAAAVASATAVASLVAFATCRTQAPPAPTATEAAVPDRSPFVAPTLSEPDEPDAVRGPEPNPDPEPTKPTASKADAPKTASAPDKAKSDGSKSDSSKANSSKSEGSKSASKGDAKATGKKRRRGRNCRKFGAIFTGKC